MSSACAAPPPFSPPADVDKAYRVVRAGEFWYPVREVRHNLPAERDAFVGRTSELRALAERLDAGTRLLTVIGPGGTGKTRFVRRYGRTWLGDWPGGVCFCDLSEVRSLDGIFFAVASALDVPLGKDDPGVQLGHAIAGRGHCLVMLDNFEQVVGHAANTVGRWLDRAADAAFIVTSRERLHLPGEEIFPIEPLPLEMDAIDLFATRARAQKSNFVLGEANRAAVAEVVRLLDGLPLAIELAAARVAVLSPTQLVERLRDRFRLLTGARGVAARQTTLRAAIDWSWDLLAPWEQAAFAQCAVFEGGFTLAAAEAVLDLSKWSEAPTTMDAVQSLVDKSLLRTWVPAAQGRHVIEEPYFGMYVSIREYAAEKLKASEPGAERAAEERHGLYFAGFGMEEALQALSLHGGVKRRRALALELENLVAACRRAVARGHSATAASAYRAAFEVLTLQGPLALGTQLGAHVLALEGIDDSLRAAATSAQARALQLAGRMDEAETLFAQSLAMYREIHNWHQEGCVLGYLGGLRRLQGRMLEARENLEAALEIHRSESCRGEEGIVLGSLGDLNRWQGRMEEARAQYQEALAADREVGNRRHEGAVLGNLATLHQDQSQFDEARAHSDSALAIHREVGNRRSEAVVRCNLGNLHLELGQQEDARAHYEASLAILREMGDRVTEGYVLLSLGIVHRGQARIEEAHAHYAASLAISRETGSKNLESYALTNLGELHSGQGQLEMARKNFACALAMHHEMGNRRGEGVVLCFFGELLARQGEFCEARKALRAGEALLRELDARVEIAKLLCVRGRVEVSAGDLVTARAALADAESLAEALRVRPEAELSREIENLRVLLA